MINFESFFLTSGVILTILISATVISYTNKFLFLPDKLKKSTNQMYDPDHSLNISHICISSKNAYVTSFEKSPCFNKTLVQWYNPWVRHYLWTEFWNEIKSKNQLKIIKLRQTISDNIMENIIHNEIVLPANLLLNKENAEVQKMKEKPIEFVYSILVGLLLISGVAACWEVFKDKLKRSEGAAAKAQERQCSLADFTINRHLRREIQQQAISHTPRQGSLELTAKVTQNLIHQSSLDRAFPKTISEVKSLKSRRNSVPSYLASDTPVGHVVGASSNPIFKSVKRRSVDVIATEISLDLRKKSRHFIRRH